MTCSPGFPKVYFLLSSDPCQSNPCPMEVLCQPESDIDFTCLRNCDSTNLTHGEIKGDQICLDGEMKNPCEVEGKTLVHADKIIMEDDIERICDDGTMKPMNCE